MKRELGVTLAALLISTTLSGQTSSSAPQGRTFELPKPAFVLHDEKLHPQKPHTEFGANGSFAVYGGTSMIQVSSFSFSGDGKLLAVGSTPGIVDVWDVEAGHKVRAFKGGTAVALSPDGHWLVKDGNGIEVIDMTSGKTVRTIPWSTDSDHTVENIAFDPSGSRILVAANGLDLNVFDVTSGALLATLRNTRRGAFSLDGTLLVGGDYRNLVTWSTQDWKAIRDLPNGPDYVTVVAVNPADDSEVVGGPNTARLLKLSTGEEIAKIGAGYTNYVAFDKTGSKIFTYTHGGFAVWGADGKQECFTPGSGYYAMALSPDGRWLAAAPANRLTDVIIWDLSEILAACGGTTGSQPGQTN
jgi:WD40 repeat protein